jgi:acetyl esterase/lipase
MTPFLRLAGGILISVLGALTVARPGGRLALSASVFATEFGYGLAVLAVLTMLPGWRRSRAGRIGALLSLAGVAFLLAPVVKAMDTGRALPALFEARFGAGQRRLGEFSESPRPAPFTLIELVSPVRSNPVRYEHRVFKNVGGRELGLDFFHPGYPHTRIPAVILVHGESWQAGSDFLALDAYLAARDYFVAAVSEHVPPQASFGIARDDVISTIAYLKVHHAELGLDPTRLAVVGRSIGGHLALLTAYTVHDPAIRGAVSLYAPTDLRSWYNSAEHTRGLDTRAMLRGYLGGSLETAGDAYDAASPITFASGTSPATLIVHGMQDEVVPPEQSERLATRLSKYGVRHLLVRLPWATHGCEKSFAGPCGQITTYAVERFLNGVMADSPLPAAAPHQTPLRHVQSPRLVNASTTVDPGAPRTDRSPDSRASGDPRLRLRRPAAGQPHELN